MSSMKGRARFVKRFSHNRIKLLISVSTITYNERDDILCRCWRCLPWGYNFPSFAKNHDMNFALKWSTSDLRRGIFLDIDVFCWTGGGCYRSSQIPQMIRLHFLRWFETQTLHLDLKGSRFTNEETTYVKQVYDFSNYIFSSKAGGGG